MSNMFKRKVPEALEINRLNPLKKKPHKTLKVLNRDHGDYNYFNNILRLFYILLNFPFTTSETMRDYLL